MHVPRFLLEMKQNITKKSEYAQSILDNALEADLVVFDEVATKELSTFEFELLPHAANVKATPESKVKLPNSLAFFIVIFLHLFGTS